MNQLQSHSHLRRWANRKSSKCVHDGEALINSRTYCYLAHFIRCSQAIFADFALLFFTERKFELGSVMSNFRMPDRSLPIRPKRFQ